MIAGRGEHAFDLMVLTLFEHDLDAALIDHPAGKRAQGRGFIMQLHTTKQALNQGGIDRCMRRRNINLGNMTAW